MGGRCPRRPFSDAFGINSGKKIDLHLRVRHSQRSVLEEKRNCPAVFQKNEWSQVYIQITRNQ